MIATYLRRPATQSLLCRFLRTVSTLSSNPHIHVFPSSQPNQHILTLLSTAPASPLLSLGTTTALPPTPASFTSNPRFSSLLNEVLSKQAHHDPDLRAQAAAFVSSSASSSINFTTQSSSAHGAASTQSGAGGGGRGGWVHLSDDRNPPAFGRIAWPEDIFGSLEVDSEGSFVEGSEGKEIGNWMESGTYRIVTNEGVLGLSDYLREKVVERLREEESRVTAKGEAGGESTTGL